MTWAYPKALYARPIAVSGAMTILDRGTDWQVRVNSGLTATFEAAPL
jgi:hypothetical protein